MRVQGHLIKHLHIARNNIEVIFKISGFGGGGLSWLMVLRSVNISGMLRVALPAGGGGEC